MDIKVINDELCLLHNNKVILKNIKCRVSFSTVNKEESLSSCGAWKITQTNTGYVATCANCMYTFIFNDRGLIFKAKFTNDSLNIYSLNNFYVLEGLYYNNIEKVLINHIVYANDNRVNEMQSTLETIIMTPSKVTESSDNISFIDNEKQSVIAGFVTYHNFFPFINASYDGKIKFIQNLERHPLKINEHLESDWGFISYTDNVLSGLDLFAKKVAQVNNVSLRLINPPIGFCTWYYYLSNINSNIIDLSLNDLKTYANNLPVKFFLIDDGWEVCWGDWQPDLKKFPHGMKYEADKIKSYGLIPGIWFAPFGTAKEAKIYKNHSDWFVKNWDNNEVYGIPSLDFSNEEVVKYISDLFHKASYDWGYRYFKIDIVTSRLAPGRHKDSSFTALKNLRKGYEVIKNAISPDSLILACTTPFLPVVGLCDCMRVSGDIFEDWDSLKYIFNSTLKRFFYHQNLFINDADCLIIRKSENEDEMCRRNCIRTDDEIQTYLICIAASGGNIMFSDKLQLLSNKQIQFLEKLFPNCHKAAYPLDIMESQLPSILDFHEHNHLWVVGFINWEDKERCISIDVKDLHAFAFFASKYLGFHKEKFSIILKPHASEVIYFSKEKNDIIILGSDSSIIPTIKYENKKNTFCGHFTKNNETQYLFTNLDLDERFVKLESNIYKITNIENSKSYIIKK